MQKPFVVGRITQLTTTPPVNVDGSAILPGGNKEPLSNKPAPCTVQKKCRKHKKGCDLTEQSRGLTDHVGNVTNKTGGYGNDGCYKCHQI